MTAAAVELFLALVGAAFILGCAVYMTVGIIWEVFGHAGR